MPFHLVHSLSELRNDACPLKSREALPVPIFFRFDAIHFGEACILADRLVHFAGCFQVIGELNSFAFEQLLFVADEDAPAFQHGDHFVGRQAAPIDGPGGRDTGDDDD